MKSSPQSRAIAVGHDIRVPFEIRTVPAGEPPATDLVEAMVAEGIEVYGRRLDSSGAPSATAEQMSPPGGTFVVIYEGDAPVAGGGVKRFSDDIGEIKRMYVVPEARSRGLARMLLSALEDAARELGYARVRLDTGPRQPHARALYESTGYREIARYNDNPFASYWAEKAL
jgi:GNAT superfamily N-acetyltransferase